MRATMYRTSYPPQAFGMELAERDMKCPTVVLHPPGSPAEDRYTRRCGRSGGKRMSRHSVDQIVDEAEFLIQPLIVLRGKRLGTQRAGPLHPPYCFPRRTINGWIRNSASSTICSPTLCGSSVPPESASASVSIFR